jgi:hypothetical protein
MKTGACWGARLNLKFEETKRYSAAARDGLP